MTWGAFFARILLPRSDIRNPDSAAPAATLAAYGPARITSPTPKPVGTSNSTSVWITRRAMRLRNRNAKEASAYEAVHLVLGRGVE